MAYFDSGAVTQGQKSALETYSVDALSLGAKFPDAVPIHDFLIAAKEVYYGKPSVEEKRTNLLD